MFRVFDEGLKEVFGVPPSYSVEQFVVLSLEGGPAPSGGVLDDGPDLSPLLIRESDSVPVELVVDFLEHMAFVDPAIDNFLLSLLDDCFSCSLPSSGCTSHVSSTIIPKNPLLDIIGNGHFNVDVNMESIGLAQFLDTLVQVVVVGPLGSVCHPVEDIVQNFVGVSSVIFDHVVNSHHDTSLVK